MSTNFFCYATEFTGPAGCAIGADLEIEYSHHRADTDVGSPEGIAIEAVEILVGGQRLDFDGDLQDSGLVAACWENWLERCERVECDRAERVREES